MESIWPFFFVAHLITVEEISPALPVLVWGCLIWPFVLEAFHLTMVRWLARELWGGDVRSSLQFQGVENGFPSVVNLGLKLLKPVNVNGSFLSGTFSQDDCEKTARQFLPYYERRISCIIWHVGWVPWWCPWLRWVLLTPCSSQFNRFAAQPSWLWSFDKELFIGQSIDRSMPRGAPP